MKYFKTSAYTGENVQEMVQYIIRQVYETKIKPEIEENKLYEPTTQPGFNLNGKVHN